MRSSGIFLGAVLLLAACKETPVSMFGASSGTAGDTSGDPCEGDIDILDHCYHQIMVESIISPRFAAAADFNDDSLVEVITTCRGASEQFAICLLEVNGDVTRLDIAWLGTGRAEVHAADFNSDDIPDILVSELNHFAVFTFENGDFVLQSEFSYDYILDDPADELVFPALPIDIEQDGVAEVVVGGNFNGVRLWRLSPTGWAPAGERQPLFGCGDLQSGRVADLDGDGHPELVAIGSHNNCNEGPLLPGSEWDQISIFTGDDIGPGIVPMDAFAAELAAARLDLGDFNDDDEVDIVVADDAESMMVFAGNGDGTFESPLPLIGLASFSGDGPHAADFNADGVDEIVVEQEDESYRILVGSPFPTAIDLPWSVSLVLLTQDLNADSRADIVSLAKSDGLYRLILTISEL